MSVDAAWQAFDDWQKEYRAQSEGIEASYDELEIGEQTMLYARESDIARKASDAALEEAAKVADAEGKVEQQLNDPGVGGAAMLIAERIRALKGGKR